jgi:hypothetical protein
LGYRVSADLEVFEGRQPVECAVRAEFGSHSGETETRIARGPVGDTVVTITG